MISNRHNGRTDDAAENNITKSGPERIASLMIIFSLMFSASVITVWIFDNGDNVSGDDAIFTVDYDGEAYSLEYTISSEDPKEVSVTGYSGTLPEDLIIPAIAKNGSETYSVVGIGEQAFSSCLYIETVNMDSVLSIGEYAFSDCIELYMVNMASVQSIGEHAFMGCAILKVIVLPGTTDLDGIDIDKKAIRILSIENVRIDVMSVVTEGGKDIVNITMTARDGFIQDGVPSAKYADSDTPIDLVHSDDVWSFSIPVYVSDVRTVNIIQAVSEAYSCKVTVIGNEGTVKYSTNGDDWSVIPSDGVIKVHKDHPSLMIKAVPNEGYGYKWADGTPGAFSDDILSLTLSSDLSLTVTFSDNEGTPRGDNRLWKDPIGISVIIVILVAAIVGAVAVYFFLIRKP